jgi:predicted ATPase
MVQEKTGGIPFFAIQFLTSLADDGLLAFDPNTANWQRVMNHSRQELKDFACLGNVAEVAMLAMVRTETEEAMHAVLSEAVRAGLIFPGEASYKFLHDRIQEAAYLVIPDAERSGVHLRIGRVLLASMSEDQLTEHVLDVANQLNGVPHC